MKTTRIRDLLAAALGRLLVAVWPVLAQTDGGNPNVVFFLADNVGYGDLGPHDAPKANLR